MINVFHQLCQCKNVLYTYLYIIMHLSLHFPFIIFSNMFRCFLRLLQFSPPIKTDRNNIAETLLKVALNTNNPHHHILLSQVIVMPTLRFFHKQTCLNVMIDALLCTDMYRVHFYIGITVVRSKYYIVNNKSN
jgi:hypothetical protein